MDAITYLVKLKRGDWSTVLFSGTKEQAENRARELNTMYQTDEYFIEKWNDDKFNRGFGILFGSKK